MTRPDSFEIQGEFNLFTVSLPVFESPFDPLSSLIARKKLDITETVPAQVTDEFIAFMKVSPDLSHTTELLVVAATLFNTKAAHLLSSVDKEDNASEADPEARDLLFSRLLQYRAFKEVAKHIDARMEEYGSHVVRDMPLEPHFASLLPELRWLTTPEDLVRLTASALPSTNPTVQAAHLCDPVVPVRVQASLVSSILAEAERITFHQPVEDASTRAVAASRFLALLELYRRGAVELEQDGALGTLTTQWTGNEGSIDIDVDSYTGAGAAYSAMASSPYMATAETEGEDADE